MALRNWIRKTFWIAAGFAGLITLDSALYVVDQKEQAVVTQFGNPVRVVLNPVEEDEEKTRALVENYRKTGIDAAIGAGLHFKAPFLQKVTKFDRRLLEWDGYPEEIPTKDKKYIWCDATARWYIEDPLVYLQVVKTEEQAHGRLDEIIDSAVRNVVTDANLIEVVRSGNRKMEVTERELEETVKVDEIKEGREELVRKTTQRVVEECHRYGIGIHDVGILVRRVSYVESVKAQIEERMIAERRRIAERYKSEGEAEYQKIMGNKEKELKRIMSLAYKEARGIEGSADAEALQTYADAYQRDPDFYQFLKRLEIYREHFGKDTRIVLGTDNDLLRNIKESKK